MNYTNEALNAIEEKLKQSKELLSALQTDFSQENLESKINAELNEAKTQLQEFLQSKEAQIKDELNKTLNESIKTNFLELFESKKEAIKSFIASSINLDDLSQKTAQSFLDENLENLKELLNQALKGDEFFAILNEKRQALSQKTQEGILELDKEINKNLKELDKKIDERFLLYLQSLKDQSKEIVKEYINEHKAELFKPFKLDFLKEDILKDEDFKKTYKEIALQSIVTLVNTSTFKADIEEILLQMNAKISDAFFSSVYLQKHKFISNAILMSVSLSNALTEVSKQLDKHFSKDESLTQEKPNFINKKRKKVFKVV
ncbi:hypothetical protein [uncultured Campylobacter sp.]|uniref:hypothetical protein n=1 Tax=uncultured Campylobacter sp. TaxID=218934 RepID=UPI00262AEB82|nr:hypothetical protein [uncultured Campylobacter sp.]